MRLAAISVMLLTACGRFGFASTEDGGVDVAVVACVTPVGHDEDGDGTDDACDTCPHLAVTQLDSDGDGVGDACDPEPTTPRQSIAYFNSFRVADPNPRDGAGITYGNDSMQIDSPTATTGTDRSLAIVDADVWIGFDIATTAGQIAMNVGSSAYPYYYANLFGSAINIVQDDGTGNYPNVKSGVLATTIHPGSLVTHFAVSASAQRIAFDAAWGDETYSLVATDLPVPYIGGPEIGMAIGNTKLDVRYWLVIATN